MRKRLSIEVSDKMHSQLKELAKKQGISITYMVKKQMIKFIVNDKA